MSGELVRLRADPKKIRVSIRRDNYVWKAVVRCWSNPRHVVAYDSDPEAAVNRAIRWAAEEHFEGIDLNMEWAYPHPWKGAT